MNGALPAEEMPRTVGRGSQRYGVARFRIEVVKTGRISFKLTGQLKNLDLFVDEAEIKLQDDRESATIELDRKAGTFTVTIAGLMGPGLDEFSVELLGNAGTLRAVAPSAN